MASQLIGLFHTRNAALQAVEEVAALGFDAEMMKVEHLGPRATMIRLALRAGQGGFIGAALGLAFVFVVPSEFLLPIMVICGAAGGLLNIRLSRPKPLPVEVEDTSVQVLVVVQGKDLETARMVLAKEGGAVVEPQNAAVGREDPETS
jgi:hypothetical protein